MLTQYINIVRFGILSVVFYLLTACTGTKTDYNALCQAGWQDAGHVSQLVFSKLATQSYTKYISLKGGNDRGAYSFYFLADTGDRGYFLYADRYKIVSNFIPKRVTSDIFELVPEELDTIAGYPGGDSGMSHVGCDYLRIDMGDKSKNLIFVDYILEIAETGTGADTGIQLVEQMNLSLQKLAEGMIEENKEDASYQDISELKTINNKEIKQKSVDPIFYEIPLRSKRRKS